MIRKYDNINGFHLKPLEEGDFANVLDEFNTWLNFNEEGEIEFREQQLKDWLRGKSCCHNDVVYQKNTDGVSEFVGLDSDLPDTILFRKDQCYYYKVKLSGSISCYPEDNDQDIDFRTTPVYVQLLQKDSINADWIKEYSVRYDYQEGNTIEFYEEFIWEPESDTWIYLAPNISVYDDATMSPIVLPIANWSRWWIGLEIKKCPKSGWWHRWDITPTDLDGAAEKFFNFPSSTSERLPFTGYYAVSVYVQVKEETSVALQPARTENFQTLEIDDNGSWRQVDRSALYTPETPPDADECWQNRALRGTAIIYVGPEVTPGTQDIKIRVYLPNGSMRQVEGGYVHVRYLPGEEGMIRAIY